ncbi:ABC1 family-domain-containing protein [Hyaloraphidium curvatum]|nr:ABC1 family-domain-containing protein [Hyaloraphidium curvatum]
MAVARRASDLATLLSAMGRVARALVASRPPDGAEAARPAFRTSLDPGSPFDGHGSTGIGYREVSNQPLERKLGPGLAMDDRGVREERSQVPDTQSTRQGQNESAVGAAPGPAALDSSLERGLPGAEGARPVLRSSAVPSSRLGRLLQYGSLAIGVGYGTASEAVRRAVTPSSSGGKGSVVLNEQNMDRFVNTLSRMRGAALKLGQMLSIQDNAFLPPQLQTLLLRVQNSANYMPDYQLQRVLSTELGDSWEDRFSSFDLVPVAAASIGQVHRAVLRDGAAVAVKVQYPGVAESIDSDLDALKSLLLLGNLLPRGLFLESSVAAARKELAWETDYLREADSTRKFRDLLRQDPHFDVPAVIADFSTKRVLTTTWAKGVPVNILERESQGTRDWIATRMLDLCLRELFVFKFMQTDPNWTNFFYDGASRKIVLLDFGSARGFEDSFLDDYMEVLHAAAQEDTKGIVAHSLRLGFLTGKESEAMIEAHVQAVSTLARPFLSKGPEIYDFGKQDVTDRVKSLIPTMLRERLTPPPEPTYSLHRKLSGAFLLCSKLRARVPCRDMFAARYAEWRDAR